MWLYHSPIGDICIKKLPNGQYGMVYDGIIWEACDSPIAEADNVYMQVTGCTDWDLFDTTNVDVPTDLYQWEEI